MYGYLEDGEIHSAPDSICIGDTRIWNPSSEQYELAGYKVVTFTDAPTTNPGYYAESSWEERLNEIVQVWTIVEDTGDIDESEAFEIIFGGE